MLKTLDFGFKALISCTGLTVYQRLGELVRLLFSSLLEFEVIVLQELQPRFYRTKCCS